MKSGTVATPWPPPKGVGGERWWSGGGGVRERASSFSDVLVIYLGAKFTLTFEVGTLISIINTVVLGWRSDARGVLTKRTRSRRQTLSRGRRMSQGQRGSKYSHHRTTMPFVINTY